MNEKINIDELFKLPKIEPIITGIENSLINYMKPYQEFVRYVIYKFAKIYRVCLDIYELVFNNETVIRITSDSPIIYQVRQIYYTYPETRIYTKR